MKETTRLLLDKAERAIHAAQVLHDGGEAVTKRPAPPQDVIGRVTKRPAPLQPTHPIRHLFRAARHKLECLRRIACTEIDDAGRFLLANCVGTYVQRDNTAKEDRDALLAEEENRELTTMEMTWADRIRLEGRVEGSEPSCWDRSRAAPCHTSC